MLRYYDVIVEGDTIHVFREWDMPDGSIENEKISMPNTVFSIRAGEYGLDPVADKDKIWDIILHDIEGLSDIQHPPIVTAATLEDAVQETLDACILVKEAYQNAGEPKSSRIVDRSAEVLAALHDACVIDHQLITLFRGEMKKGVKQEKGKMMSARSETRTLAQKTKSMLIDRIMHNESAAIEEPERQRILKLQAEAIDPPNASPRRD